jgi:hypothetical protein
MLVPIVQGAIYDEDASLARDSGSAHIPKFEFRKRIAELKGERIPMSADEV